MKNLLILAAAAALFTFAPSADAQKRGIDLGMLDCRVEGGAGFIIGSTKDVMCTFTPANKKFGRESYHGVINKIGLDSA